METKDHLALGYYLINNIENSFTPLQEKLFLLGNIMPDVWLFSYANGIKERKNFNGHVHSNARKRVEKHSSYLKKHRKCKWRSSFILGVMMHYLADSFTYPHSDNYEYGIGQHKKYENELHRLMWRALVLPERDYAEKVRTHNINHTIKNLYSEYKTLVHNPATDCRHIIKAAERLFAEGLYICTELNDDAIYMYG